MVEVRFLRGPSMSDTGNFTEILRQAAAGSDEAMSQLFDTSYRELLHLARRYLRGERSDHTLQTSALVNEAYMRMVGGAQLGWNDRAHFFATAAQAMRRILIDHARRRLADKRMGNQKKVALGEVATLGGDDFNTDLVALDMALSKLQEEQPEKARVVEMRFFAGMTMEEIAEVMGVSNRTVHRHWAYAQARLYKEMTTGMPYDRRGE